MATTFLKPKNNATGVLLSTISPSATEATLASGQGALFPSTFPYHVTIDNEIIRVTNRSTDVLTFGTRAVEDTTAASHNANTAVDLNVTAQQITDIHDSIGTLEGFVHNSGTYAAYDVFYATGGSQTARLAVGGTGQFLGVSAAGTLAYTNPGGAAWKVDQTPTGTINSSNTLFVVPDSAYIANSLQVYRNGVLMTHGSDYAETSPTGGSFTMVTAPTAGTDVFLRCNYLVSATPSANADTVDGYHAGTSSGQVGVLPLSLPSGRSTYGSAVTIASTWAAIGTYSSDLIVNGTNESVICLFMASYYPSDTTTYVAFGIGYGTVTPVNKVTTSFNAGATENNRKPITLCEKFTGLAAGTYTFKPFWQRDAGSGTGNTISSEGVFIAFKLTTP